MDSPPSRAGSETHRSLRAAIILITLLVGLVSTSGPASAFWNGVGSASAAAVTGTLASPVGVTVADAAPPEVPVTWNPGVGGPTPEGYYVTRHAGETSTPACLSGPTALLHDTTCTDGSVPDGEYSYTVTAVFRTWTASSSPSGTVIVAGPRALAFTSVVADPEAGASITPAVTVALQTADGTPYASSGVIVTIALGDNPGGGTLSGATTATTDAAGVATFGTLSIDQPGVGYTLTATSSGLSPATSNPFTVMAPPLLGAARSYSVLAGTAVTSTGATTVSGDLGVSPGTSVVGFGPGTVGGQIHAGDAEAAQAHADLADTFDDLSTRPADGGELLTDLGGRTLAPGVYHSTAALALTGTLILDAQGDPDALFIFQAGAAFNTAAASAVTLINDAQAANVYWVVTGAAGAGADSFLSGTIVANGAITLGARTELIGRALSLDAVTLAANKIRFTTALPATISIDGGASAVTKDTTPTVTGTSSAAAASPVTVTVSGQTLSTTVSATGTWTVTAADLSAGSHTLVAGVREANGNGNSASQTLTVEVNPPAVALGSASTFSVLAGTGVVNTGNTTMTGDLGVSPGTSVTGFGPGTYEGSLHAGDATAAAAQADLLAALDDGSTRSPHTQVVGDLGNRTFHIGVHHSTAALALTGTLTLDAEGNADAVFIFQTDAAFNTAAASGVNLINGAKASNVFWIVTGAAGTGADSTLAGTILARGAITLGANTVLAGQALSRDTVTMAGSILTGVTPAPTGLMAEAGPAAALGRSGQETTPVPASTGDATPEAGGDPETDTTPSPDPDPTPEPSLTPSSPVTDTEAAP